MEKNWGDTPSATLMLLVVCFVEQFPYLICITFCV